MIFQYIHYVVQRSALSNSRTFPSPQKETPCPSAGRADASFNPSLHSLRSIPEPDLPQERVIEVLRQHRLKPWHAEIFFWIFLGEPRRRSWCNLRGARKGGLHKDTSEPNRSLPGLPVSHLPAGEEGGSTTASGATGHLAVTPWTAAPCSSFKGTLLQH